MARVTVVTDTCHYLPAELVERHGIKQVSLYVNWGDPPARRTDRESDLADYDAYYDYLRTLPPELPTTSQPSVGDFLAVYEPIIAAGDDVFSVHLSGGISGTVQAARQARDQLVEGGVEEARIEIMDGETACGGLGMVALAAAVAAERGAPLADVAEHARAARADLRIWFCIDTLEFLKRGGRIGSARAWIGSTLKIKPILTLEQEITPVERVRTARRAFERMVEYLASRHEDGADGWVIQHIQAPDVADRLVERGRAIFGSEPLWVSEVGPVIGTHVGPGLFGVGGLPRRYVE